MLLGKHGAEISGVPARVVPGSPLCLPLEFMVLAEHGGTEEHHLFRGTFWVVVVVGANVVENEIFVLGLEEPSVLLAELIFGGLINWAFCFYILGRSLLIELVESDFLIPPGLLDIVLGLQQHLHPLLRFPVILKLLYISDLFLRIDF